MDRPGIGRQPELFSILLLGLLLFNFSILIHFN